MRLGLALAGLLALSPAFAHPGGLAANGCHMNRQKAVVECHKGPLAGMAFPDRTAADRAYRMATGQPDPLPANDVLVGRASVIDGDTIEIRGERVRLHGVDAPESRQTCFGPTGQEYRCGQLAALALSDLIGEGQVDCEQRDRDRYGRIVGVCHVQGIDLNEWLVRQGWAVAYSRYSTDYVRAEEEARAASRGVWAGTFTPPEEWRRLN